MNVYLDSSVVIRVVFGEADPLRSWHEIEAAVSSEVLRVECLRTIDRARLDSRLPDDDIARRREAVLEAVGAVNLVRLDRTILDRAAEPFPTSLGTLDAIHLASALLVREQFDDLLFATHDRGLGIAARAMGFQVEGI
jgi:predicted nucleic acid-binding protein